jgi:hypothetical protein
VSEDILLKLSLDVKTGIMEMSMVDNTTAGSTANRVLYPLAMGISVVLEKAPSLLYAAGTELYDADDAYIAMDSDTKH